MGGSGSGTWYRWEHKDVVEDFRSVDVRRFHREGLLEPGPARRWIWLDDNGEVVSSIVIHPESDHITLRYRWRWGGEEGSVLIWRR